MKLLFILLLICTLLYHDSEAQTNDQIKLKTFSDYNFLKNETQIKELTYDYTFKKLISPKEKPGVTASTFPIAIGVASFFYLLNPIVLFENDKIALGFTKEVSVGFGYFGEHRASFEYSYIFRKDLSSNIRLGYKYDILLKRGIKPSNSFQGTTAISIGGGYFHNFSRSGYFAESSYGYSIRNHKVLFYPSSS
jgi:hypothetical protein